MRRRYEHMSPSAYKRMVKIDSIYDRLKAFLGSEDCHHMLGCDGEVSIPFSMGWSIGDATEYSTFLNRRIIDMYDAEKPLFIFPTRRGFIISNQPPREQISI